MEPTTPRLFDEEMQAGHAARDEHDNHSSALDHYYRALELVASPEEEAAALQAAGVSLRVIGMLPEARFSLTTALESLPNSEDVRLIGAIHRDLAEVWHDMAVEFKSKRDRVGSIRAFDKAEHHLGESRLLLLKAGDRAEELSTVCFLGQTRYDRGMKANGAFLLRKSVAQFRTLAVPNEAYEVNAIIRLLRCDSPRAWTYLPRALKLTSRGSASSGRRMHVIVAACGNKVYLWAKRRRQG